MPRMTVPARDGLFDCHGCVALDAPCLGCGYNLRTMLPDRVCPECARPVADSVRPEFLRFASPRWVRALARGLLIILVTLAVSGVVIPGALTALGLLTGPFASEANQLPEWQHMCVEGTVFSVLAIPATCLLMAGVFRLTRPEPGARENPASRAARLASELGCCLCP